MTVASNDRSAAWWILIPAVVMSLAWGLRGYIGGGPLGAMIPGALVTLMLCRFLGCDPAAAAVVVAFGTFGVGFGGMMTYGQTLGLIRESETFWWGLTGTTVKGAVWGLLAGAVLGLGFAARHLSWRHVILPIVLMLVGAIAGRQLINVPKLIYFSDPVNEPREEWWAGLLLGGLAILLYLRVLLPKFAGIAERFAAYGVIGGGLGFGVGSLFLASQRVLPEDWKWLPLWKFMEFFFGLLLGAAFGWAAMHLRNRLEPLSRGATEPAGSLGNTARAVVGFAVGIAVVAAFFYGWFALLRIILPWLRGMPEDGLLRTAAGVLLGISGMFGILLLLSRAWSSVAWQAAISITIVATAIDWQRDLLDRGHIDMPWPFRLAWVLSVAVITITFVAFWQQRPRAKLMDLFLFATCVLMAVGYMMGLAHAEIWWPQAAAIDAAGGYAAYYWNEFASEIIVHGIFTTLFAISVWAGLRERRSEAAERSVAATA